MINLDWLHCMREANCPFDHYHSYLEVSFVINVLVGGVWRFIQDLVLRSRLTSQERLERKKRWISHEALTEELDNSLDKIQDARGASDPWVQAVANWGRGLCFILAVAIPLLLLLLDGAEVVPFWAMAVFFLVPALMVVLTCLIHYGWAFLLYLGTEWAFRKAKKALGRKFDLALKRGAGDGVRHDAS